MKKLFRPLLSVTALAAVQTSVAVPGALQFDGQNDYVTFGAATSTLGASNFTLECWFKKTGTNSYASTGTGGIYAEPLITKGRGEADSSNLDCNYFFGITTNANGNVLGVDLERFSDGQNFPVRGRTRILHEVWYHAAATYDGATWRLYLNGNLETNLTVNALPRWDSIQHAALGSALTSSGAPQGYFRGALAEARIWNYARSQAEIRATMYQPLTNNPTGLVGRWALDDGAGASAANSVPGSPAGTLTNGPVWTNATPFVFVPAGATWKYLDNGSDQGTAWSQPGYDDSAWASGPAPLGYGDPWIVTTNSYGPNSSNKYITYYYRRTIIVTNAAQYSDLLLRVQRDDGIAVYLNGVGVYTNNLPATFNYTTWAPTVIDGVNETNWQSATLPVNLLADGANVIAAEVHQRGGTSSDLTFNLELLGVVTGTLDLQPPSVPAGLYALAITTNQVQVNWSPSSDNEGGSGLAGYLLYRNGTFLATNAGNSYVDSPVLPLSNYCYRVAAYDVAGNTSALSAPVCLTPATADADNDGLPDWWEHAYFGHAMNADPAHDADRDGQNNGFEYLAQTDPTNRLSRFEFWVEYVAGETNPVQVIFRPRWESRDYIVNSSTNLVNWVPLTNSTTRGTGVEGQVVDLEPLAPRKFYRVTITNALPPAGEPQ